MRKQILALAIVLAVSAAFAQQLMNNEALIKMVAAGLSDAIIVATIQSSRGQYDTSPDALIALKKAGVDDAVLAAVFASVSGTGAQAAASDPADPPPANSDDPNAPHEAGIYICDPNSTARKMTELEPSVYSQGKSGGAFASAYTHGIVKAKTKAVLRNAMQMPASPTPTPASISTSSRPRPASATPPHPTAGPALRPTSSPSCAST